MSDRRTAGWQRVGLVATVILLSSLLPVPFRRRREFSQVGPDKLLHLLGYAGLGASLAEALDAGRPRRRTDLLAALLATAFGLVVGRLQRRVPGRRDETADTVAGVLGAALAVVVRSRLL